MLKGNDPIQFDVVIKKTLKSGERLQVKTNLCDKNGENATSYNTYHFLQEKIVFYDGEEEAIELHFDVAGFKLRILTIKQINMLVNIDAQGFVIEGIGKLHIIGQINTSQQLILRPSSLKFVGNIFSAGKCIINTNKLKFGNTKRPTNINLSSDQLILAKSCALNNTKITGKRQEGEYNAFSFENSLYIASNAQFIVANGHVKAGKIHNHGCCHFTQCNAEINKMFLNGVTSIDDSQITTDNLQAFKQPNIKKSKFVVNQLFACYNGAKIQDTKIKSNLVVFEKELDIKSLKIRANELKFSSTQAIVRKCNAYSKFLTMDGGNKPDVVNFHDCKFITENFDEQSHITLTNSRLIGIGNKKDAHTIYGHLQLKQQSRYITNGQVHVAKQSSIKTDNCSVLQASYINLQSKITSDRSCIFGDSWSQQNAQLEVSNSSVKIEENFHSTNSNSYILYNSTLNAGKIHFGSKDKSCVAYNSSLNSTKKVSTEKNTQFLVVNSYAESDKFALQGTTGFNQSILQYEKFQVKKNAQVVLQKSKVKGKNIVNSGELRIADSFVKTEDKFLTKSDAITILQGNNKIDSGSMKIKGDLVIKNKKNQQNGASQLKVTKKFEIDNGGEIQGDGNLLIDAYYINYNGEMNLQGGFFAKGKQFKNHSKLSANNIYLGVDHCAKNNGSLSADNIVIHSNFLNAGGRVFARQCFNTSGIFSINVGAISANNYSNDVLLSANFGLIFPNFSADPKYIFSFSNLWSAGKHILTSLLPGYTNLIHLAAMVPNLYNNAQNLYAIYKKYDLNALKSLRPHEIMPLICQFKSATMLGVGAFNLTKSAIKNPIVVNDGSISNNWGMVTKETFKQSLSILGGSYNDSSLLHSNFGVSFAFNTAKLNLLHLNSTSEYSLLNHNINTRHMYNYGLSGGKYSVFSAKSISNFGILLGNNQLVVKTTELHNKKSGLMQGENVNIKAKKIDDAGSFKYSKICSIESNEYNHSGEIKYLKKYKQNLLYIKTDKAKLTGKAKIDNANIEITNHNDAEDFIIGKGKYKNYKIEDYLRYATKKSIEINEKIERNCDLFIEGNDITLNVEYDKPNWLGFKSTKGDVKLLERINNAKNLSVESSKNIVTNNIVRTKEDINFKADGIYWKLGGSLKANVVRVQAQEIKGITKGSQVVTTKVIMVPVKEIIKSTSKSSPFMTKQTWTFLKKKKIRVIKDTKFPSEYDSIPIGDSKGVYGETAIFLEATDGNIEFYGDKIKGNDYTQLIASGDVLVKCNIRTYKGPHDTIKEFDPAIIKGGSGSKTKGVGLYIKAGRKIISDASNFISDSDNYFESIKGIEFKPRHHTYISWKEEHSSWLGFVSEDSYGTTTIVKGTEIHSNNGRNIFKIEKGGIKSVASTLFAKKGTDIYASGDIKLESLITQDRVYKYKRIAIFSNERGETHESATPNIYGNNGNCRVHSYDGNVDARGAYFIGDGNLWIEAKKRIFLSRDILNHIINEKTFSLGFSMFGVNLWNTIRNGGSLWKAILSEDTTLNKINSLVGSKKGLEFLVNGANLGIDLYNTFNSIARGIINENLGKEMLARYKLGGKEGFNPKVTFSLTRTETKTKYQTLGIGGINVGGNVKLKAGEEIVLENGVPVLCGKNMEIDTPKIHAYSAKLESSFNQESYGINVGATFTGIQDVGISGSTTKTEATNHVNAMIYCKGNMKLHNDGKKVDEVVLDGANIIADTLDGGIKKLVIKDKQDTSRMNTASFSVSTSGKISGYVGNSGSKKVKQHSGIHVNKGLNTGGHYFKIDEAKMLGGKITTDGDNNLSIDKLVVKKIYDDSFDNGFGLSCNIKDFERLGGEKSENSIGEKAIAVVPITVKKDGLNLQFDVPITNNSYLEKSKQNIKQAIEQPIVKRGFFSKKQQYIETPKHNNVQNQQKVTKDLSDKHLNESDNRYLSNDFINTWLQTYGFSTSDENTSDENVCHKDNSSKAKNENSKVKTTGNIYDLSSVFASRAMDSVNLFRNNKFVTHITWDAKYIRVLTSGKIIAKSLPKGWFGGDGFYVSQGTDVHGTRLDGKAHILYELRKFKLKSFDWDSYDEVRIARKFQRHLKSMVNKIGFDRMIMLQAAMHPKANVDELRTNLHNELTKPVDKNFRFMSPRTAAKVLKGEGYNAIGHSLDPHYDYLIIKDPNDLLKPVGAYPVHPNGKSMISPLTIKGLRVLGIIGTGFSLFHSGHAIAESENPVNETLHQGILFATSIATGVKAATLAMPMCFKIGCISAPVAGVTVPICLTLASVIGSTVSIIGTEYIWNRMENFITQHNLIKVDKLGEIKYETRLENLNYLKTSCQFAKSLEKMFEKDPSVMVVQKNLFPFYSSFGFFGTVIPSNNASAKSVNTRKFSYEAQDIFS